MFEKVARPVLFRLGGGSLTRPGDAETAHEWTLRRLATVSRQPAVLAPLRRRYAVTAPVEAFGVRFPNAVGLAAGMDKDGVALPAWPALGFGFVEVGTVTRHAQPGNDRPRLYRLPASGAVINRMGFNNAGAAALADRLAAVGPLPVPLGISLGKSRVTPIGEAVADYVESMRALLPYGDYFAVNVSSPNTPGLRSLQDREQLAELVTALCEVAAGRPVLVKIAPDLTEPAIAEVLSVITGYGGAGVIATNTTLDRSSLEPGDAGTGAQAGGLSGRPLHRRSCEVVSFIHRETGGRLPVIGVGGIDSPDDALRLRDAGATLVQLYTGFIYHGPALVRSVARALARVALPGA